ncbi:hypothetical protein [Allonocardiopsis opalescens]|uniref:Uncharacterized protein n=1 Tax=Allonocardiopsis opalescens TaxID=1144618 RepID=A0A2T0QAV6_9ACTN|nr:hypothetical protein [Allonocardiopsis opalescens]PRY01028.1 hypothetical protein CLV72_102664 [Allonocardiopsis opalescens]
MSADTTLHARSTGAAGGPRPALLLVLRVSTLLTTLALLAQAVTAGLLLSSPDGRVLHSAIAYAVVLAAVVQLAAAVLFWRPGGGPAGFIANAAGLAAFTAVQIALGVAGLSQLHVPVGVLMFAASTLLLVRTWSRPAGAARS